MTYREWIAKQEGKDVSSDEQGGTQHEQTHNIPTTQGSWRRVTTRDGDYVDDFFYLWREAGITPESVREGLREPYREYLAERSNEVTLDQLRESASTMGLHNYYGTPTGTPSEPILSDQDSRGQAEVS